MLAGIGTVHGLDVCLVLLPPSGHLLRVVFRLRMWFADWLDMPAPLQFGRGFPGRVPGGVGVGGPLLVSGVVGLELLAFGGQLFGEGRGARRARGVLLSFGVGGLLVGVGFGLGGEPELPADVERGGGAGVLTVEGSCFELAAVQAAENIGFVADFQRLVVEWQGA